MLASRKRKSAPGTAGSPAVASAAATADPYNPLRDRELLAAAVQTLASAVVKEGRRLTAMEFCVEVLRALGLAEIAIGQAERIFISSARKAALADRDAHLVTKPPPATPVAVPDLDAVAAALREFRSSRSDASPPGQPGQLVQPSQPGQQPGHADDFGLGARLDANPNPNPNPDPNNPNPNPNPNAHPKLGARLEARLDAAELRASSLVHMPGLVSPAEVTLTLALTLAL